MSTKTWYAEPNGSERYLVVNNSTDPSWTFQMTPVFLNKIEYSDGSITVTPATFTHVWGGVCIADPMNPTDPRFFRITGDGVGTLTITPTTPDPAYGAFSKTFNIHVSHRAGADMGYLGSFWSIPSVYGCPYFIANQIADLYYTNELTGTTNAFAFFPSMTSLTTTSYSGFMPGHATLWINQGKRLRINSDTVRTYSLTVTNTEPYLGVVTTETTSVYCIPAAIIDPLVSIEVQRAADSLKFGESQQYTAVGTYSSGTTRDITSSVTWALTPD